MIVGIVIGAGIFKAPSIVAGSVASSEIFIALWVAGGVISFVGALCYAELGSAFPNAGGEYYFLTRAFGRPVGFLFAWARMSVVQTGAIAAIAFVFGDYATQVLPLGPGSSVIYAALAVLGITALNIVGTRESRVLQNVLLTALLCAVAVVIVAGLAIGGAAPAAARPATASSGPMFSQLALIFILLTYGGWNEAAYLTAEIRDARRNIVRALVLGILVVTVIYVLLNLAYLNVLGLDGMKASKAVAADLMQKTLGGGGAAALSLIVIAAALSTLNATVFTGARTNYAVGRDFSIFRVLGVWKERSNTPVNALLVQGAVALALVILASFTPDGFETMVAYTAPAFWLFFMLTGISLFVLRAQEPVNAQPFRVPLYPLTPILFCAMCAYMLYSSTDYALSKDPSSIGAQLGIGVLLLGLPLMFFARRAVAARASGR
ncbi:MAG: amino acid permease [Betaproteobacteria bacterium]|nr:amino acid permease [Betaproteobacteria bacterium]